MTQTIDLIPEEEARLKEQVKSRLKEQAERTGTTPEEAVSEFIKTVTDSPGGNELVSILLILFIAWLAKERPHAPEVEQALGELLRPFLLEMLKEGNEEELASILPKMPAEHSSEHAERVRAARGKFAHVGASSQALLDERRQETEKEERQFRERTT